MSIGRSGNGFFALVVLVLGGALSYWLMVSKPGPEAEAVPEFVPPAVDVVVAAPGPRSLIVETQGTVEPLRQIQLVNQVGGRVEQVSQRFAPGAFFGAGETLVKIEEVDYLFAIARAESQVAAAKQIVAEEEGRAMQAKREWRDLGSVKGNALFLREPQLAAAKASLKASEADLSAAQLDLARTEISAPFNGRITEKHVDVGQFVAPGTAIATIYDTDVAVIRLPLTDRQVALLDLPLNYRAEDVAQFEGSEVVLRARFASREWQWRGRIVRTDAMIDVNSRVVYAVAEVEKPFAPVSGSERPPLAPGLFVHATIDGRQLQQVSQLPRSAMRSDGSVMVVGSDERAESREVQVLRSDQSHVWVQGLAEGERVIVREPILVISGMEVAATVTLQAGGES